MRIVKYFFIPLTIGLVGCSLLSPAPSQSLNKYVLTIKPNIKSYQNSGRTIMVSPPKVSPLYSTHNMIYTTSPYKVAYFAKNSWADTPAQMLQPLIIQTLQSTHYYKAVVPASNYSAYDRMLNTQLMDFKQVFHGGFNVFEIRLNAQVIESRTHKILAAKAFTVRVPAPACTPEGGVIAANLATEKLLAQLANWVVKY